MSTTEKTISFRAVAEKIDTLDSLAAAQDRSRSYLINEAITNYIELHAYQDEKRHCLDLWEKRLLAIVEPRFSGGIADVARVSGGTPRFSRF